jgi:mannose-6-phosphate isomerase-like protein (cupin superfamily)
MLTVKRWDPALGPLQLSTLRNALQHEGMVTAWWSDVPGTCTNAHVHPFPETRWVLSGYLRITAGAVAVELGPGDRLDVPPGTTHVTEVLGLAPAIYVTGTTDRSVPPAFALAGQ